MAVSESTVEEVALGWFGELGYEAVGGPDTVLEPDPLRASHRRWSFNDLAACPGPAESGWKLRLSDEPDGPRPSRSSSVALGT